MRDIMRDIRFRAWNKETKEMNYDVQRCKDCDSGECFGHYFYKDYILMQYTGLHDKNGKEIYEGDIVSYIDTNSLFEDGIYKVGFQYGSFMLYSLKFTTHDKVAINGNDEEDYKYSKDFEVIGNIYEHSYLVDK